MAVVVIRIEDQVEALPKLTVYDETQDPHSPSRAVAAMAVLAVSPYVSNGVNDERIGHQNATDRR